MELVILERTVDGKTERCRCTPEQAEQMTNPLHTFDATSARGQRAAEKHRATNPHPGWKAVGEVEVADKEAPPVGALTDRGEIV